MSDDQSEQAIRERAYAIWEQEGHPDHRSLNHWLKAEIEIGAAQVERTLPAPPRPKRAKPVDRRQPELLMPVSGGKAKKKDAAAAKPAPVSAPAGRRKKAG